MLTELLKSFSFHLIYFWNLIKDVNCRMFRLEFRLFGNKFGVGTWLKHVSWDKEKRKEKSDKMGGLSGQGTRNTPNPPLYHNSLSLESLSLSLTGDRSSGATAGQHASPARERDDWSPTPCVSTARSSAKFPPLRTAPHPRICLPKTGCQHARNRWPTSIPASSIN